MKLRIPNKTHTSKKMTDTEKYSAKVAYLAASEAMVLLENNGVLPLHAGKIALYGAGAGMTIKGGSGSGEVNERHAYTIQEGLEKAGFEVTTKSWIEHYSNLYQKELKKYKEEFMRTHKLKDVVNIMAEPFQYPAGRRITEQDLQKSDTDTCIYVIARQAGEGADRKLDQYQYHLTDTEREHIRTCTSYYEKVIVVINVGSSFDTKFVQEIPGIDALVYYCQQGSQGGRAFADLILGRKNFSGRLTSTWAKDYYDFPFAKEFSYLNGNLKEEYYQEGIYVGYRYFDTFQVEPAYPFGYGLSYTDFRMKCLYAGVGKDTISLRIQVTNVGTEYSGKEVVQVYVSCPEGRLEQEYQKLAAFEKTGKLEPGESEEVDLSFELSDLASYDEVTGYYILYAGEYLVRVGHDSRSTKVEVVLEMEKDIITRKCEKICKRSARVKELSKKSIIKNFTQKDDEVFRNQEENLIKVKEENLTKATEENPTKATEENPTQATEENPTKATEENPTQATEENLTQAIEENLTIIPEKNPEEKEALLRLPVFAEDFDTIEYNYERPVRASSPELDDLMEKIPAKDLVKLLTGPGYLGGKKCLEVPGAEGYTTGELAAYGIPNVALADGPAGLRLQRISAVTGSGTVKMIDAHIDVLNYLKLPKLIKGLVYGNPKKDTLVYQFTTSFPVGQALAQTWNTDLIRRVGQAVSGEMSKYGVSYWLAPALNIQRNPLCGRNFEYYSEDPLVAGKIAAAMCQGVQSEEGNFVTIKHFCCNNQEDNRNHVNENLNERALREIYLKAFEIAVKEGEPGAVMSSYNKVNGEYVNNSYDLLTKVLRNEWGYQGFVMTDWFATGKDVGDHVRAIKAGNDLLEPGGLNVLQALERARKKGELTEREIRDCAANVLKGIIATKTYQEFLTW